MQTLSPIVLGPLWMASMPPPGGGEPGVPSPNAMIPAPEPPRRPEVPNAVVARGVVGDVSAVAAKWMMTGALMMALPTPWNWVVSAAVMGALGAFGGFRILVHILTQNLDRYEVKYSVLMGMIDYAWKDMLALRREPGVPPHERAEKYRQTLDKIRNEMLQLEEMRSCDPNRVFARGQIVGLLMLLPVLFGKKKDNVENAERHQRDALVNEYRSFVNSLPEELPSLPPEENDEGGYRVLPARMRVEITPEFQKLEEELEAIEEERRQKAATKTGKGR